MLPKLSLLLTVKDAVSLPSPNNLGEAAGRDDWIILVDVPLCQRVLSRVIDQASFNTLVGKAHDIHFRALAFSSTIHHVGDRLNVPSNALGPQIYTIGNFVFVSTTGLAPDGEEGPSCTVCEVDADHFGDHQVIVGVIVI